MALERLMVTIAYEDGRQVKYPLTPKLQMTFERDYKIGVGRLNEGPDGVTNALKLARHVQQAHLDDYPGALPTLEDWLESVVAVDVESEAVVPFVSSPPNGGSLNLPSPRESLPARS